MNELHLPWLEMAILIPSVGAFAVSRVESPDRARRWCMLFSALTLLTAVGGYLDFKTLHTNQAHDLGDFLRAFIGPDVMILDDFNAPLLPLTAVLFLLTTVATLRTKVRRFSFAWSLVSEAIVLATLTCKAPWVVIALLAAATVPPYLELCSRGKSTRVYTLHMALFIASMVVGWTFVELEGRQHLHSLWAVVPLLLAIFIRCGIVPVHCWVTDLFENATFGTALLFVTPLTGAYAAVRLVLPIAPDWVLRSIGLISLTTAVYAAGMALVQREARRFFCYIFLSHSALVLVGLETATPLGLTGALCVWLSVGLALAGLGLTMRALEARHGRLSLTKYHGLYEHTPALAICFMLTGMASVGFPGTFGFLGTELLVDAAVDVYPLVGIAVVVAAAINGIAVVKAYFLLFTGTRLTSQVSLQIGKRERFAVITLALLILVGGLFPQYTVSSRHTAALRILQARDGITPVSDEHLAEILHATPTND